MTPSALSSSTPTSDTDFLQGSAEVFQKRIELSIVQLGVQMCLNGAEISTGIRFWSAKQRGDKHTLVRSQMSQIGAHREVADTLIGQNPKKEGVHDGQNRRTAANETKKACRTGPLSPGSALSSIVGCHLMPRFLCTESLKQ